MEGIVLLELAFVSYNHLNKSPLYETFIIVGSHFESIVRLCIAKKNLFYLVLHKTTSPEPLERQLWPISVKVICFAFVLSQKTQKYLAVDFSNKPADYPVNSAIGFCCDVSTAAKIEPDQQLPSNLV